LFFKTGAEFSTPEEEKMKKEDNGEKIFSLRQRVAKRKIFGSFLPHSRSIELLFVMRRKSKKSVMLEEKENQHHCCEGVKEIFRFRRGLFFCPQCGIIFDEKGEKKEGWFF